MAGALVGTFTAAEGTGNLTTGSRTTTAGNLITGHAASFEFAGGGTAIAITDNKSNTFTEPNELAFGSDEINLATAYNANGTRGATHTLTATFTGGTGSSDGHTMVAHEWSGIDASPTVVSGTNTGTSTAPSASATAGAASLYIGMVCYGGASTTIAPNGSTQASETDENSDFQAQAVAYRATLTGSNSVAWTLAASREWGAIVSAFTEAAASGAMSGTASWTWGQSGTLRGDGALTGTIPWTWSQSGTLRGSGALAGTAAWSWSQSGTLRGVGALAGTASWSWGQSGTLAGAGALAGTIPWTWDQSGNLTNSTPLDGAISGTASWTWGSSATLAGAGALAGSVAWTWGQSATLGGAGALAGSASWTWGQSGTLRGAGTLAGSSSWTWAQSGELINLTPTGDISGAASWSWSQSGLLIDLTPPIAPAVVSRGGDDVPPHPRYEIHEKADTRHKDRIRKDQALTEDLRTLFRQLTGVEETRAEAEKIVRPILPQLRKDAPFPQFDSKPALRMLREIRRELITLDTAAKQRAELQAEADEAADLEDIDAILEIIDQL